MSELVEGWYQDPQDPRLYRWWDGKAWTDNVHDPSVPGSMFSRPIQPLLPVNSSAVDDFFAEDAAQAAAVSQDSGSREHTRKDGAHEAPGDEYLTGSGAAAAAGRSGARRGPRARITKLVASVTAVFLVLVAGAAAAFVLLSGSGPQPEDVMPADTVAFAKIDFNPDADQKINLVRFLNAVVPDDQSIDTGSGDPLGDFVISSGLLEGSDVSWQDISPWLGNRVAAAIAPMSAGGGNQTSVPGYLLVAVKDEELFRAFMQQNAGPDIAYEMALDGYAVIASDQRIVEYVINAPDRLADAENYRGALRQVGTGQIFASYVDLGGMNQFVEDFSAANDLALADAAGAVDLDAFGLGVDPDLINEVPDVSGSLIISARVQPNAIDVEAATYRYAVDGVPVISPVISNTDLGSLPASTVAALSIAGLGDSVRASSAGVTAEVQSFVQDSLGVSWSDLMALLDSTVTLAVVDTGAPMVSVVARVQRSETVTADFVTALTQQLGLLVLVEQTDTHVYISGSAEDMVAFSEDGPRLEGSPIYRELLSDPGAGNVFVDMSRVWELQKREDPTAETVDILTGVGITVQGSEEPGSGFVRVRVTFTAPES